METFQTIYFGAEEINAICWITHTMWIGYKCVKYFSVITVWAEKE